MSKLSGTLLESLIVGNLNQGRHLLLENGKSCTRKLIDIYGKQNLKNHLKYFKSPEHTDIYNQIQEAIACYELLG